METTRPDIVMIMTDQHAARVMGCAGDSFAQTPGLDTLAGEGTRFENCYCASPLCVPSRAAFLTGLEPHDSGVLNNDCYLPSDMPTIAHAMTTAGYDCHLVGRMHFNGPDQTHGFSTRPIGDIGTSYPGGKPPNIGVLTPGRGNRGPELEFSGAGETSYQAYDLAVADQATKTLAHLREQRIKTGKPFFLLLSLFCPHPPYIARKADFERFIDTLPAPRLTAPAKDHPAIAPWRKAGGMSDVSDAATRASRAAYYALVTMIDRIVAATSEAVSHDPNTVTIYTSDHGECLGERGLWWKSVMYDESSKVPLIVRGADFGQGETDGRIVSLMDLSATLLGLSGAEKLPGHTGTDLRQRNDWSNRCISAYYGGLMNISLPPARHRMIRTDRHKLTWYDGFSPQLFDLVEDPDETCDLASDPASADLLDMLTQDVFDGWNPQAVARQQAVQAARSDVMKSWVKATRPPEPMRWIDPDPSRNAYD